MLRDLARDGSRTLVGPPPGPPPKVRESNSAPVRQRPRLLIVHCGDTRLRALEAVLSDDGYDAAIAATSDEAIAAIARGPAPDVLLTTGTSGARRGVGFARECLARWPSMRAMYVTFVPRPLPDALGSRECVLIAPFNADQLAAALADLWPGAALAR